MALPPNMKEDCKVILFDGVCKLCNFWSQFIIKNDRKMIFMLASVQSLEGQQILKHFNMPTDHFDTMLYVEGDQSFEKSDAFLKIVNQLDLPWKLLNIFRFLPGWFRNWLYDRIALNRYALFGKYDQCLLPTPDHAKRYLRNGD